MNGSVCAVEHVDFHFAGLTPEWKVKAELTLGETEEKKRNALNTFRDLISNQKNLKCRPDDIFLLRFIRLKKYDLDKALKLLLSYYSFKTKHVGVYNGLKPSQLRHVVEMGALSYAPYRLPGGQHIALLRMGEVSWSEASVEELVAGILVMAEMILDCEATQLFGACLIVDLRGFTLTHYLRFCSLSVVAFVLSVMQDCWPGKIDSIHVVNEPAFCRAAYTLLQPVLKQKTRERLHLHGGNLTNLHKFVPPQYLPQEVGGTLGPTNYKEFASYFLGKESYIEMLDRYGLINKKSQH